MAEYDPWGLSGPIRNIGGILAQTPRLRAEAEAARQRGQLTEAQIGTEGAQAEHYRAQTRQRDAETGGMQSDQAGDAKRAEAMRRLAVNPNDAEALAVMLEESGRAMRRNPDKEIQGISRMLAMFRSLGATNLQGADPVGLATAGGRPVPAGSGVDRETWEQVVTPAEVSAQRPTVVQPGAAVLPPRYMDDRTEPYSNPSAARSALEEYETTTTQYPATEGTPGNPGSPAVKRWFGKDTPEVPATPATPGQLARTVTTRRRIGEDLGKAGKASAKALDKEMAAQLLKEAGGDKALARQLAAQRGYTF